MLVSWMTTNKCNLKCVHCYQDAEEATDKELSCEEGKKMIDEIARAGFKVMIFSGGEPLMRPDIYELVAHAASRGLRPVFGSNGTLITPELAARFADVWVTVTGNCKVVDGPAFENMKDGAIVCNSGHFDSEINLEWLEDHATKKEEIKPLVEEYTLPDGRTVIVLAQGRLVNLSCAEGHPASVMDMSFANQALAAEYLYLHAGELENKVYDVPAAIDTHVARVKLETLGIEIDTLTEEQIKYMSSWNFETL